MEDGKLIALALEAGAGRAAVIEVGLMTFDPMFRRACEQNSCGMYGRCWVCPPDIGDAEELIAAARRYRHALVYQTVSALEDSFDIEGMLEAGRRHNELGYRLAGRLPEILGEDLLQLAAGGCRLCPVCAKREGLPCRFPETAMSSLEAYCVNVSALAELGGMKYINGRNTVTYFGAVLFGRAPE